MTADSRRTRRELLQALAGACAVVAAACTRSRRAPTALSSSSNAAAATGQSGKPTTTATTTATTTTTAAPVVSPPSPSTSTSATPRPGKPASFVPRATSKRAEVALTFHGSGDPALAAELMGIAEHAGAHLTVFAVGQWLAQQPDMAKRITGGGHELANHTWTHPSLGRLGAAAVLQEITRCRDEIAKAAGRPSSYFRPSAMRTPTPLVLKAAGTAGYGTVVGYDVDTLDFRDPGPVAVRRLAATARAGSIVSLHFGHRGTVAALPGILADLRRRGLTAVTVGTLLRP